MRDHSVVPVVCADCTAKYATLTVHRSGTCDHDSNSVLVPLRRADLFVPADSLERSPRVGVVEMSQLFVLGRDLYRNLTRRDSWSLNRDQIKYALEQVVNPFGGATFKSTGGTFDQVVGVTDGYAVTIRPRAASPVALPLSSVYSEVDTALSDFIATSPYIGVFRDETARTIDVDPVAVVPTLREANALGVYCRSTGGAYRFLDGLGYWAPVL